MLKSLPESIGNLTSIKNFYLQRNLLTSIPRSFGNLTSLEELNLRSNPIKTLSNFPLTILKFTYNLDYLTIKGKKLHQESKYDEILEYYFKTPEQLALDYVSNPHSLTVDDQTRLIHEVEKREIKILENSLPVDDPILRKIIERESHKLSNGSKIFF